MIPKVVAFDLDGTLAVSKAPLTDRMAGLLTRLCGATNVAITSGAKIEQYRTQVVGRIDPASPFDHLYLLPTSGAALFVYRDGQWQPEYQELLSPAEARTIEAAISAAIRETGILPEGSPRYGAVSEYRGSQVTFSALGQEAPVEEKYAWDPDQAKRRLMLPLLCDALPGFDVKIGGATSIDITKKGVNKAFGLRRLSDYLRIPISQMLYVGDALFPGGNDEVVKETGIETRSVRDPEETAKLVEELLAAA